MFFNPLNNDYMKHILLPTDFSENAWRSIQYSIELHHNEICTFHLLNAYTPTIANGRFMVSGQWFGEAEDMAQQESKAGLQRLLRRIHKIYKNERHAFRTISTFALLVDEIKEVLEKNEIDLIVTGTKGVSDVEEVSMGSNTARILNSIGDCPVLSVPVGSKFVATGKIAFLADFDRSYPESVIQKVVQLAQSFNSILHVVNLQEERAPLTQCQQGNLAKLRTDLNGVEHHVHIFSRSVCGPDPLVEFFAKMEVALLVLPDCSHKYMERMAQCPVLRESDFHTKVPLLSFPQRVGELCLELGQKWKTANAQE